MIDPRPSDTPLKSAATAGAFEGPRCPTCVARLESWGDESWRCPKCGNVFESGGYPGALSTATVPASFSQPLDALIDEAITPMLDELTPATCTERPIAALAAERDIPLGNPVTEGRADILRLLCPPDATVADIGAGFGTNSIAMARGARHVFAIDQSPARVRLSAARARAEGLRNVTPIHADGRALPLGNECCSFATSIGVMEWVGANAQDPLGEQRRFLKECARILKPGGTLVIAIENRFAGHYFAGAREEHIDRRFVSLLPRPVAHAVVRRTTPRPRLDVLTHSRRGLQRLLRDAGFAASFAVSVPSYQHAELVFGEADAEAAWQFYFRHTFNYSSTARRLAGAVARRVPARTLTKVAPTFFVAAVKDGATTNLPTVVTGSADCGSDIKVVDWTRGSVKRRPRLDTSRPWREEPLIDGWNARRWMLSPTTATRRCRRAARVVANIAAAVDARERVSSAQVREVAPMLQRAEQAGFSIPMERFDPVLELLTRARPVTRAHGDLRTANVVLGPAGVVLIDERDVLSLPARDAVLLLLDVAAALRGQQRIHLSDAATAVAAMPQELRAVFGRWISAELGPIDPELFGSYAWLVTALHSIEISPLDDIGRGLTPAARGVLGDFARTTFSATGVKTNAM